MIESLLPNSKCQSCEKKVKRKNTYELKYKTLDGMFSLKLCPTCAATLTQIMKDTKSLYENE